jgi:hypothetical protein
MKAKKIIFYFAVIALCAGCSEITEGVVTDKRYTPEETAVQMSPVHTGKNFSMQPRIVHHAERWTITIGSTAEGEERLRDISVTRDVFEKIKIGDFLRLKEDRIMSEDFWVLVIFLMWVPFFFGVVAFIFHKISQ